MSAAVKNLVDRRWGEYGIGDRIYPVPDADS